MPGIVVNTTVRTGPSTTNVAPTATWFVVGETQRGPAADPKLVTSISDFETTFGTYVAYGSVYQQVQTFFEEGGAQCYVSRVVGGSATAGIFDIPDVSAGTAATLTAVGPGAWSSGLSATLTPLGAGKILKLYLNDDLIYSSGEVASAQALVNKITSSALASKYVSASVGSGADMANVSSPVNFTAGDDNRGAILAQDWYDAMNACGSDLGSGAVSVPGLANALNVEAVHQQILNHCYANHRIAIMSTPSTFTSAQAGNHGETLGGFDYAEYGALYWPWVNMKLENGTSLTISPEGYVAAKRSVAFNQTGPWTAYAGAVSASNFITGLAQAVDKTTGDALDEQRVNALRIVNNAVRVYGFRSLSADEDNFRFLNSREMLNYVVVAAEKELEDLVFSPIDGRKALFTQVQGRLIGLLEPIRLAGGLFEAFDANGKRIDYGYSVMVNDAINPVSQLAGGLVKAKVGIRISSIGDQIQVDVTKSNLTASVV